MIKLPKITVITATFNLIKDEREHFFRQCVESVHNQTYPNIEHIVMDGASTDGTLDLIKEYEEKGWLKCYSEPDEGMWEGMNKGLKKANGEYICFLNSDDYYTDQFVLEKCVKQLEKTDADYLYGDFDIIRRTGEFYSHVNSLPIELFYMSMPCNHEALIVKKKIYENLNFYDEKYRTTIDYAFVLKLILNDCSYTYLPCTMITARLGGTTTLENGTFSEEVIKTVSLLFKDVFGSFYPISDQECKEFFLNKKITPVFVRKLREFIIKKDLKNFNYLFFLDEIKQFEARMYAFQREALQTKSLPERSLQQSLSSQSSSQNTQFKKTWKLYLFSKILLLKIVKKSNNFRIFVFGFIPFFKWKVK